MNTGEARLCAYIERSICRLQLGQVKSTDGSWLEGIFTRATRHYEQWARQKLEELLRACSLRYDDTFRPSVPGNPLFEKLTLGQIATIFQRIPRSVDQAVLTRTSGIVIDYRDLCGWMFEVNNTWIKCVKHGYTNLDTSQAIRQLTNMKKSIENVRPGASCSPGRTPDPGTEGHSGSDNGAVSEQKTRR
jgi:hypothetical protein